MAKSLSVDLRRRVVEAVVSGLSRRAAADRFGVSVASAVRWHQQFKATTDTVSPNKQGGDRRSKRIEAYSAFKAKPL